MRKALETTVVDVEQTVVCLDLHGLLSRQGGDGLLGAKEGTDIDGSQGLAGEPGSNRASLTLSCRIQP